MKIKTASRAQIQTILSARVDSVARKIEMNGLALTHRQADEIGDLGIDWLKNRLGLQVVETDHGVVCTPVNKQRGVCEECGKTVNLVTHHH